MIVYPEPLTEADRFIEPIPQTPALVEIPIPTGESESLKVT